MRRVVLAVAGLVFGGLTALSLAVPASQSSETRFVRMLGDDVVLHIMAIARQGLGPESAADREQSLIAFEDGRRVVDLAAASAAAAWCGVEWQESNFGRLMRIERESNLRSDKAMAYIGLLHGVAMDMFARDLSDAGACPARRKADVVRFLAQRWS
jgi:hypothetical protein